MRAIYHAMKELLGSLVRPPEGMRTYTRPAPGPTRPQARTAGLPAGVTQMDVDQIQQLPIERIMVEIDRDRRLAMAILDIELDQPVPRKTLIAKLEDVIKHG